MKLAVLKKDGKDSGKKVTLADSIYNIEPNDHAIYLDVKQYLANQRQGTHKTKERAEIHGSTRKVKRQKGTGTARMGSIKSPIFRGGGRTFGPRPKNHGFKLNKKVKLLARKSALSYKAKAEEIMVIEDFRIEQPKTRNYLQFLKDLAVDNKKTLLVVPETDNNMILSIRNLQNASVILASQLNTYEVLHADNLLLFEGSLGTIENLLN
jgi:large subunit ribosomal protein L4